MKKPLLIWATGSVLVLGACSDVVTDPFDYGSVEVEAVRRSGEGVPGVELVLFSGTRHLGYAVTNSAGRAGFSLVPFGTMGVTAKPPEGYRPLDLAEGWVSTFHVEEGEERRIAFTYLKFGPGTVTARVLDSGGQPMARVEIELFSPDGVVERAQTGPGGTLVFADVPFGEYGLRTLSGRGYTIPSGENTRDGILVEDGVEEEVRFTLERCLGRIVVLARDTQGAPLSGVPMILYEPAGVTEEGETSGEGAREFRDLPCGDYGVRAEPVPGYRLESPLQGFVDGLRIDHGTDISATFVFRRCIGVIRVRVRDPEGSPVAGTRFILYSPDGVLADVEASASGEHAFLEVPCGADYAVRVTPPEGYTVEEGRGTSFFDAIVIDEDADLSFEFVIVPG